MEKFHANTDNKKILKSRFILHKEKNNFELINFGGTNVKRSSEISKLSKLDRDLLYRNMLCQIFGASDASKSSKF